MKHPFAVRLGLWMGALALPLAGLLPSTFARQSGAQKLTVNFPNWKNYTDIRDAYSSTDQGEQANLDHLKRYLERDAGSIVPDGEHLTITFSDIKLAGDFEPQHGGDWDSVRFMKSIWYPRFTFTWELTDQSGRVIKQGKEHLADMNYKDDVIINDTSDPLQYEDAILHNWMSEKIR